MSRPASPVPALQRLLAGEHAAIYGYGALGARLPAAEQAAARSAYDGHRARRDAVTALLRDAGATPPAAQPAYAVPELSGAAAARRAAVAIEDALAGDLTAVIGATQDAALRRRVAGWLQETVVRAAGWRLRLGAGAPEAPALPGLRTP